MLFTDMGDSSHIFRYANKKYSSLNTLLILKTIISQFYDLENLTGGVAARVVLFLPLFSSRSSSNLQFTFSRIN